MRAERKRQIKSVIIKDENVNKEKMQELEIINARQRERGW
jgi:hypothetical protein